MKTKREIIKEIKDLNEEEYRRWECEIRFGEDKDLFYIDPFPHQPYFHPDNDHSTEYKERYKFYPYKEKINPEELEFKNFDYFFDPRVIKEKDPIILKNELRPMHYSISPRVLFLDWQNILKKGYKEIADYIYGVSDQVLVKVREKMIQVGLQCKLVPYDENYVALRVRIGSFKKYLKFREALLELSQKEKIRSTYDYEEIRNIINEKPVILIN